MMRRAIVALAAVAALAATACGHDDNKMTPRQCAEANAYLFAQVDALVNGASPLPSTRELSDRVNAECGP